jgi:ubiquinone biosynthesis protein UbiJ
MARSKRRAALAGIAADVRRLRRGAKSAVVQLGDRGARLQASVEKQLTALGRTLLRQLHAARAEEVAALRRQLAAVEGRIGALERKIEARPGVPAGPA